MPPLVNVVDILKNARALIEDPKKWGRGLYFSRPGTCCAAEAIEKATRLNSPDPLLDEKLKARKAAYAALRSAAGIDSGNFGLDITRWNDTNPHEVVLSAFDKAIATEEKRAASK